jgi:hypothetical protein
LTNSQSAFNARYSHDRYKPQGHKAPGSKTLPSMPVSTLARALLYEFGVGGSAES